MPIKVFDNLPAKQLLLNENIFVIDESRAFHQDIRPLKIAILNLMPDKLSTEVQLLRLLSNTPLQQEITLLHTGSHVSKNTSSEYLLSYYTTFDKVQNEKFDGFIITGAPIEHLEFEDVTYWKELKDIMEWTKSNVTSTLHICWGAQAGLYYHYGVCKHPLESKMFGIFRHHINPLNSRMKQDCRTSANYSRLLRGFDSVFYAPQSRHTEIFKNDVEKVENLAVLCESDEAGVYLVASKDLRQIFITGHSEYDSDTLKKEYERDLAKGLSISLPKNYFENDDPSKDPAVTWRAHANILFSNWLNIVYQETPFKID